MFCFHSFSCFSVPERVYKKINSSEVWCIFLKTKLYDNSKKCFLKIFALHPSPLDTCIFRKKHPREKCQKVDPHYFSILEGVYFLPFFSKKHSKTDKRWKSPFSAVLSRFLARKIAFWGAKTPPKLTPRQGKVQFTILGCYYGFLTHI